MTTLKADDKEESPLLTKNPSTGLLITTGKVKFANFHLFNFNSSKNILRIALFDHL